MKVLIIPDKFKGTLTAREAGEAIAVGWRSVRASDLLEILPMSDGGDGFGPIIGGMMGASPVTVDTVDAAGRPRVAEFWWDEKSRTAVIETAQVNGLALLPPGKFHPFELDTFGLGKVFQEVKRLGAKKALVGIGGSATNDGGFGLARALGWKFFDGGGTEILRWVDLDRLEGFQSLVTSAATIEFIIACDVQNPLLGPLGASRIYGPQKGLREEDMGKAEACLGRLAEVVGRGIAEERGTGAAGGLGFGLRAFMDGRFVPGADVFAEAAKLDERLRGADLVISGEGAIDVQSLMGKGVGSLFERAKAMGVRRMGLAGSLGPGVKEKFGGEILLMGIVPELASLEKAKQEPASFLAKLAAKAASMV